MHSYEQASAFLTALNAGASLIDFRAIHDQRKDIPAIPFRGTLAECWPSICAYNSQGYGIFCVVAEMDGLGRELPNVRQLRAHYVDLDNLSALQNYERAAAWRPAPSFAVNSSPGKYHVYWPVVQYAGNDRFQLIQRKLTQLFDSDRRIIDAARVMRLPGTVHAKGAPHVVTCWALPGWGYVTPPEALEGALADVNVIDHSGQRSDLGTPEHAAPSVEWLKYALAHIDPNTIDRGEWISITAAVKQAGWSVMRDEHQLYNAWSEWCARYAANDLGENLKQWNSIRQTEVGWNSIVRRVPSVTANLKFVKDLKPDAVPDIRPNDNGVPAPAATPPPAPPMPMFDCSGELLTDQEQQQWFKDCMFVVQNGTILTGSNDMLNSTQFNGAYGGKKFIIDGAGKVTNEPWQAATRSTLWTVPKVSYTRFIPERAPREVVTDDLGRAGVNIYRPARIAERSGDVSPFLNHIAMICSDPNDRRVLLDYIAHNVRFPGFKIPWAPVFQSAEGVGKGVIKSIIEHCVGPSYTYFPNVKDLADSGSKFNEWMRHKLFILADEIKVDDRRDMIEVLKPMISEKQIEVQAKGENQKKEDNYANWMFFSNWKNAIPVDVNARRFAIIYSPIQSKRDLAERSMDDGYFSRLYNWLDYYGGKEIVAHYLLNYPIDKGAIPMRAPNTSSAAEAIVHNRSPLEQMILHAIEDGLPGFRGGWISTLAVISKAKALGMRPPAASTVKTVLEAMHYHSAGRAVRPYFQEDKDTRTDVYCVTPGANPGHFGRSQGYE